MFCTQCGVELRETDRFCSQCGRTTGVARETAPGRALRLDTANKKIAGVCAGFARYFDVDVVLMRVIWLVAAICTGLPFIAYLVCWLLIPKDEPRLVPEQVAHPVQS